MAQPNSALGATDYQTLSESNGPLIPCVMDKSGSSIRAKKREKARELSAGFRQRQKQLKEALEALEGKEREIQTLREEIQTLREEIQTLRQEIQTLRQEIQTLEQERDYYRSERNFLQQWITQTFPSAQLPKRPVSPRLQVGYMLN
jgi:septal ring factor EnvC (AmiA/AmiB activator)